MTSAEPLYTGPPSVGIQLLLQGELSSKRVRSDKGGHETAARLLLDKGAHIDISNDYDQIPLHLAADLGLLTDARLLLDRGAAHNLKDFYGWTPLYRAADHGHNDFATLLADYADAARKKASQEAVKLEVGPQNLVTQNGTLRLNESSPAVLSGYGTDGPEKKAIKTPMQS
ncbi:MAG: hypothetical protein Q9172_002786 [Xanthocarpia lactea]